MTNAIAQRTVKIDYPKDREPVTYPQYTIRVDALKAEKAYISIDDGPWQECRMTDGYFWYDWSNFLPGWHEIRAKAVVETMTVHSSPRRVEVRL